MYQEKSFACMDKELTGISKKTMEGHYKLYQGYVKKSNEIMDKLAAVDKDPTKANQVFSDLRSLKVDLTFALGGMKNHEVYFGHLGGDGSAPTGSLGETIYAEFGSYDAWKQDMKATGMAGRGWAWLGYDWDTKKLFNYIGDTQNTYPVWNVTPLVALDVYEHAYWSDFGGARADYIDAFFANLDWSVVEKEWEKISADK